MSADLGRLALRIGIILEPISSLAIRYVFAKLYIKSVSRSMVACSWHRTTVAALFILRINQTCQSVHSTLERKHVNEKAWLRGTARLGNLRQREVKQ